jgi:hypothetical protein
MPKRLGCGSRHSRTSLREVVVHTLRAACITAALAAPSVSLGAIVYSENFEVDPN